MAYLNRTIRAEDLPQDSGSEPVPEGWYSAKITECVLKDTKAGTGQYIKVRYDITGPTHQGRVVFGNLNIRNQNPKAEEIGMRQLGELMRAIGLAEIEDTDQLVGGACQIKVAIRQDKDKEGQYPPQNEIKAWKATTAPAASARPAEQAPAPAPAAQSAPTGKPPWAR